MGYGFGGVGLMFTIVNVYNSKHFMKNKEYKVISFRLDPEVTEELEKNREKFRSWNLLFRDLLFENKQSKLKLKK